MRRSHLALTGFLLLASASGALANGRPANTSTINFRHEHETDIIAGMTFGAVLSHDGGATWHWICEDAVGYAGVYDPDYAYTATGAIFATTFKGLVVNRNGCTFDGSPMGMKFTSSEELGNSGALHVGVAHSCGSNCPDNDVKLYRSDDDGVTFPVSANPGLLNDWWQSIRVAKSDPDRMYVSGYRFVDAPGGGTMRVHLLLTSANRGVAFTNMSQTGLVYGPDSVMEIAGVSPLDPKIVFLRVTFANGVIGDAIYRSVDAGATWTKIHERQDSLAAFVVRANGDVVVAAPSLGAQLSTTCKTTSDACTFTALAGAPHLNCLVENTAGEVWGCTQNFGGNQLPGDGFGIMKTTDLVTWTGVLKFQDIKGPVDCAVGTIQKDKCEKDNWCAVKTQLGITADPTSCAVIPPDTDMGQMMVDPGPKGCCDTGADGLPAALIGLGVVGFVVLRRRKNASSCSRC
ncbi:MAG: hypothetical protein NT062_16240 [Proteobacteria bacterium]|nr:hypothetical protein [Pseudomonadota bacterium]